jgi:hypothetical protein
MLTALLLHITLVFPAGHPSSPLTLRTAVTEAAALWSPYGVAIDGGGSCEGAADDTDYLSVEIVETRPSTPPADSAPLGAITFGPDGGPAPILTVFLSDLLRFVSGARVRGAFAWQWPRSMRDEIIGRVLGRVLAHEIGHYVLRSPRHGPRGLMQRVQFADALVAPERRVFGLSAAEAARLQILSPREADR